MEILLEISCKKYRYDFTNPFLVELDKFSICHINDHRHVFNKAWAEWLEQEPIACMIIKEKELLLMVGYSGDIMEKMYHHARYSLKKKLAKEKKKNSY